MTYVTRSFKCENCIRPVTRRLGLFQAKDEYECYAESYIKCFWGLCDQHKSIEKFVSKPDGKVITMQPQRTDTTDIPLHKPAVPMTVDIYKICT